MAKIKVTIDRTCGSYKKQDEYVYPYSEYSSLCDYIKRMFCGGSFDRITIERKDK